MTQKVLLKNDSNSADQEILPVIIKATDANDAPITEVTLGEGNFTNIDLWEEGRSEVNINMRLEGSPVQEEGEKIMLRKDDDWVTFANKLIEAFQRADVLGDMDEFLHMLVDGLDDKEQNAVFIMFDKLLKNHPNSPIKEV